MSEITNSTENLLDLTPNYSEHDYGNLCANNGLNFQILAKKVTGKRLTLKDCYLMVNAALRQVGST